MARSEPSSKKNADKSTPPGSRIYPIPALFLGLAGLLLLVAILDFSPAQSEVFRSPATERNVVGMAGTWMALFCFWAFGVAGFLLPGIFFFGSYLLVTRNRGIVWVRMLSLLVAIVAGAGLLSMQDWYQFGNTPDGNAGGRVGSLLYEDLLRDVIGPFGSLIALGLTYAAALGLLCIRNIGDEIKVAFEAARGWKDQRAEERELLAEARAREKEAEEGLKVAPLDVSPDKPTKGKKGSEPVITLADQADAAVATGQILTDPGKEARKDITPVAPAEPQAKPTKASKAKATPPAQATPVTGDPLLDDWPDEPLEFGDDDSPQAKAAAQKPLQPAKAAPKPAEPPPPRPVSETPSGLKIVTMAPTEKATHVAVPTKKGDYLFPPLSLLTEPVRNPPATDESEHARNANLLLKTLGEFGVTVTLGEIHSGPVITRYEVFPAPGVRVEKIAALDKNLALALRAQSVRILAPVPGKGCVGIEVPNAKPTPVGIRELIESQTWNESKAEIPLALGREVDGAPVVSDLTRMPHLLIAGATGSGKSVCINAIVASLVYRFSPADLRLIMVDPKIVELSVYNDLPHMLIPVVTNPKKVPGALKWLIGEMERRYQAFAKVGVRNIVGFNNRKKKDVKPKHDDTAELNLDLPMPEEEPLPERYPYIVAIIDEIADLMMVAPAEIEQGIARLAQLARAAGIHLILATQRPSVNVITGVIKANLPCRIAFQVSSHIDSRTIIDTKGAEQLIGRGDMLFSPPGSARLSRAQGAFLADEEVRDIVEFLKKNGPPAYADDVQEQIERSGLEDEDGELGADDANDAGDDDPMLPQALAVLRATRRASTSMLQRRLRIGYNRAARLMELMESKGIVGPENGAQPRDILVDIDSYQL